MGRMSMMKAGLRMTKEAIDEAKEALNVALQGETDAAGPGARSPEEAEAYAKEVADAIRGDVRMFSGCMDCQTSADVQDVSEFGLPDANGAGGACTNAFLLTLDDNQERTWLDVLKGMQGVLQDKEFSQVPQLSTSRQIDVHDCFTLNPSGGDNTRALLIGINYTGQQGELNGCHNDANVMKDYIASQGFRMGEENCRLLVDDGVHSNPDREGIMAGFKWLVAGAVPGSALFMLFSGHGGNVEDTSGDEADGMDETIVPVDYLESGQILDDEIFEELVMALPEDVTLTVVMDCCHSGSVLDLPYAINGDDGTIGAVEAGERPSLIGANLDFFYKMMGVGKKALQMYRTGKKGVKILGQLARKAMS